MSWPRVRRSERKPARVSLDGRNRLKIDGDLVRVDGYDAKSKSLDYVLAEHAEGAEWVDVRSIDDLKPWECALIDRANEVHSAGVS